MVSALDSGASGLGSSTGRGHCVVFLGKTLNSHIKPLSVQVYKWIPAICVLPFTGVMSPATGLLGYRDECCLFT